MDRRAERYRREIACQEPITRIQVEGVYKGLSNQSIFEVVQRETGGGTIKTVAYFRKAINYLLKLEGKPPIYSRDGI